jgi:hypothetical protein
MLNGTIGRVGIPEEIPAASCSVPSDLSAATVGTLLADGGDTP